MWSYFNFFNCVILFLIYRILIYSIKKIGSFLLRFKQESRLSKIQILEVTTEEQCETACFYLRHHCGSLSALGFDCEWVTVNGQQRPVALLQLATVHGKCCLFRLNVLGKIPQNLQNILSDSDIIKLGVSPLNDARLLNQSYNAKVRSTLDLRYLYPSGGGLASLAESILGVTLDKSWRLKCSNWEAFELTDAQKDYAAKDAFVAVEIFKKWLLTKNNRLQLHSQWEDNDFLTPEIKSEVYRYLDIHFKPKNAFESSREFTQNKIIPEGFHNQNQKKEKSSFVTRKSPLYHNCFMHAPDGELLCSCDKRKAQWYLDRGLAEVLSGEPYSIKLLFEPAARAGETNGGRFYQQLKQNCCVVCGAVQSYLKHNVVPKEYRRHFPNIMKDHQSHDIVLMCVRCHQLAAQHNEYLKQDLAILCNAPIKASKVSNVSEVQKVKNSAKALLNAGDFMPFEKKIHLENEIKRYFEVDSLNLSLLNIASNLESKTVNENAASHGIKVVNYFIEHGGGLMVLELLWRKHFLETMKPQYLPALWSVNHNHSRLLQKQKKTSLESVSTVYDDS